MGDGGSIEENIMSTIKYPEEHIRIEEPIIFGASVSGKHHNDCQDAWDYTSIPGTTIVMASDGAGGVKEGGLGARIAVESVISSVKELAESNFDLQGLAKKIVYCVREALEKNSQELQIEHRDLSCTLIITVIQKDNVSVAHVGDGGVVCVFDGKLEMVSDPEKSEYVNEPTFITSKGWESSLRVSEVKKFNSLAIFTDGIQRGILIKDHENYIPYKEFFDVLFDYASEVNNGQKASGDVKGLLESEKFLKLSDDDKTLVVVTS